MSTDKHTKDATEPEFYRVHWKARFTDAVGHGSAAYPKDQAQAICDSLQSDEAVSNWVEHWIESAKAEVKP